MRLFSPDQTLTAAEFFLPVCHHLNIEVSTCCNSYTTRFVTLLESSVQVTEPSGRLRDRTTAGSYRVSLVETSLHMFGKKQSKGYIRPRDTVEQAWKTARKLISENLARYVVLVSVFSGPRFGMASYIPVEKCDWDHILREDPKLKSFRTSRSDFDVIEDLTERAFSCSVPEECPSIIQPQNTCSSESNAENQIPTREGLSRPAISDIRHLGGKVLRQAVSDGSCVESPAHKMQTPLIADCGPTSNEEMNVVPAPTTTPAGIFLEHTTWDSLQMKQKNSSDSSTCRSLIPFEAKHTALQRTLFQASIYQGRIERRPAYFANATPSNFCHVCGRRLAMWKEKEEWHAYCRNLQRGLCRKVVCKGCFTDHNMGDFARAKGNSNVWECCHCSKTCPPGARCEKYREVNSKIRLRRILGLRKSEGSSSSSHEAHSPNSL